MPRFSYIARSSNGSLERGTLEASDAETAREVLRRKGFVVEQLQGETLAPEITLGNTMPWTATDDEEKPSTRKRATPASVRTYVPLMDTVRIFAGWLLAWYAVVFVLGSLQLDRKISEDLPFVQALFQSPLVLRFSCATFLVLLLSSLHRWMGG